MIDPLCVQSAKKHSPCPVCSGTYGKEKVHTMQELIDQGYEEPKKDSKKK